MKMNEVCKRTNLTERTIRFYIEKGLLHTKSQIINGRINRDFTEDDVEILKDISKLRKAGFSIPDILDMQNDNRNVQVIVLQHYNKLKDESELRESQYYLSVYSTNPSIDHGYYFESPSTLKIDNEILFHSLLIDSEPYLSTLICIEIPAEDMLAHNWDILNMEFLIQTILENPNFISKYCVVKQIQAM